MGSVPLSASAHRVANIRKVNETKTSATIFQTPRAGETRRPPTPPDAARVVGEPVTMSGGATVEELKDVLRETLENRGALGNVRAHLRAEVSNALEDRSGATKRPELSDENLIINELIREYLVFNRYRSTLSVLLPESGQPETPPFDRDFLAREMRVRENENSRKLPLLYTMVSDAQRGGGRNEPEREAPTK